MRLLAFIAIAAMAAAAPARFARLGDFDGTVEVQLTPSSPWIAAERNLPLPESAWVRTGAGARVEIELDDGSGWRLGPDSQGGLSDYTALSTGQRITLIAIDRGIAYFNGENHGRDSVALAIPGAQLFVNQSAQLRLEVSERDSQVFVLQGNVNFSSPAAALELKRQQTVRVEPDKPARFSLEPDFQAIELDQWNAARLKALAGRVSGLHVSQRYGLADLDAAGEWIQTTDWGLVWKPKVVETWVPFENGRWRWYDRLGYTWVSGDSWGWLPYHYGRWAHLSEIGWVWSPAASEVFHPGEVYWMRAAKLAGWGPLAPGEDWQPMNLPRWYLDAYTTFAAFSTDAEVIDPAGFDGRPTEPLRAAGFAAALPSPAFRTASLDAVRPQVRANVLTASIEVVQPPPPPPPPPVTKTETPKYLPALPVPVVVISAPPPPPEEVYIPVPVLESVVIYAPIFHIAYADPRQPPPPGVGLTALPQRPLGRPPATPGERRKRPRNDEEGRMEANAFGNVRAQQWTKAMSGLEDWAARFPESDYVDDRLYYMAQASHYMKQPDRVLELAATVMAKGGKAWLEPWKTVDLAYLVATETAGMKRVTAPQRALGHAAAQSLVEMAGKYFVEANRPPEVTAGDWQKRKVSLLETGRVVAKALEDPNHARARATR